MLALRCDLRHELRLKHELRLEIRAPSPPDSVTGLEGMEVADSVLKEYSAVGMLIGGLAKELWRGCGDGETLDSHKDVDVLVLTADCEKHPKQWESGVDWWISHNFSEKPTNGALEGIFWQAELELYASRIKPGLYLCPRELLVAVTSWEKALIKDRRVKGVRFTKQSPNKLLPILDILQLRWKTIRPETAGATICKPYRG